MTLPQDGAPAPRRRFGAPKNWRQTFLAALADTSNVRAAAQAADISLTWVYKTRREDAQFADQWFGALCEGYQNLEMELLGQLRAPDGERRLDVANALRLLAQHRQSVARHRAGSDDRSEQEVLDSLDAMIDDMRERAAANAALLAQPDAPDAEDGLA